MRDFTLKLYQDLLRIFELKGYSVQKISNFINTQKKTIILRHDIDAMPSNALVMAIIENKEHVKSSFFFKTHPDVLIPNIIQKIISFGHEIGYHYEDLVHNHGNYSQAISDFERNLETIRKYFPVISICAEGNPLSRYNNLWLWDKYDYKRYGIKYEMYLDINYNETAYFTDTGRSWNGEKYNVWDKVESKFKFNINTTYDLIKAFEKECLPDHIALNMHPQRWSDNYLLWLKELIWQNVKNQVKRIYVK